MQLSKQTILASAMYAVFANHAMAQTSEPAKDLPSVTVTSTSILPSSLENLPGSSAVLTEQQLDQRKPFSIIEAVREVPGLYVVAEDAAGTHLNIGLRGLNPRRSSRTLLLEDGAPTLFFAPYGDPSSHYSTPLDRLSKIEVLKGSGQILYGPQTLGGMVNFVTKPVPQSGPEGSIKFTVGNQGNQDVHLNAGTGNTAGGLMVDVVQRKGDGIRQEHGFDLQEFALKGQIKLNADHRLTAKYSRFEERSLFTETGLTAAQYLANPRSLAGSSGEEFVMDRDTAQLIHEWDLGRNARLTTQAYYTETFRQSRRGREFEVDNAATGVGEEALETAIRPRNYEVFGFEPKLEFKHKALGVQNETVLGFRYHSEKIDRQKFMLTSLNGPIDEADERLAVDVDALSYYAQNTFLMGNWTLTPGVRIEDVDLSKTLYAADATDNKRFSATGQTLNNNKSQTLPGLGFTWNGLEQTTLFGGIHRGFAPPRPDRDIGDSGLQKVDPELATVAEFGVRSSALRGGTVEATLFNMNIDDIVIQSGGVFRNEGKAQHTGVELGGRFNLGELAGKKNNYFASVAYTHLATAKFKNSGIVGGEGEDGYGSYRAGNRLPYAPKHSLTLNLSYENPNGFEARVGATHLSKQFANTENISGTSAQGFCPQGDLTVCGLYGEIPSLTLYNASVSYSPQGEKTTFFASAENLSNEQYFSARTNGIQPGRDRLVLAGVKFRF